ncbi:FABP family protein [Dermacoccaceae bacterium W4C1]
MPFELDVNLPTELAPLAWLIGRWEGAGVVGYPTMESANFGQEVDCQHDGGTALTWNSRIWILDEAGEKVSLYTSETGYWRPLPDGEVELLLAHPDGVVEMYTGSIEPAKIEVRTDAVVRSPHSQEYTAGARLLGYVNSNLMWAYDKAAEGQALTSHMSAELKRVG